MRIRTVLTAAVSASIVLVLALALGSWVFVQRLEATSQVRARAQASARNAAELLVLTQEYSLHAEERMAQQWRLNQAEIVRAIAPSNATVVPELQEAYDQARALSDLFSLLENVAIAPDAGLNARRRQLLQDQLLNKVMRVSESVQHWVDAAEAQHQLAERHFRAIAIAVPMLMLIVLLLLAALLVRRVLHPLARLRAAVAGVARGETSKYAASHAQDEIGEFSRSFDAMAVDMVAHLRAEIAQREEAQIGLAQSQARLHAIIENEPECIKIVDAQGRLTQMNPAGLAMIEAESLQQVLNLQVLDLVAPEHLQAFELMHQRVLAGESVQLEFEIIGLKGTRRWMQTHAVPLLDHGQPTQLAVTRDITEQKKTHLEIEHLAFFDPLTKLPNRRLMIDRLGQALTSTVRRNRHAALMLIDLDNFKAINDTLGHGAGDQVLVAVAARLISCIREGDTAARLGGDEFVVILQDLDETDAASAQAEAVALKIQAQLNEPYLLDLSLPGDASSTRVHHSTASMGISLFLDNTASVDELMKRADAAMYQAKLAGRNVLRFFDPKMQAAVTARSALEADLREAVIRDEFLLHYQAQVHGDGRITGVEALLRWQHPARGMVPPGDFISLAEESDLILPIGAWVLETACGELARWANTPALEPLTMAVNVSARQFHQDDFVDQVLAVLVRTGANPRRLKLELTESLLVLDLEGIIGKMARLKAVGVGFALDDFGTGYSSLSYLKRLPLDQLKIDRGFVRDILIDPNDAAIAKMVVALAQTLGLGVIAEGVETQGQRQFLADNGCLNYQGFLYSRALPIVEFESLALRAEKRDSR